MAKYSDITSKEDHQQNKLNKHCSKLLSKTPKMHHLFRLNVFIANFEQYLVTSYARNLKIIDLYKDIKSNGEN